MSELRQSGPSPPPDLVRPDDDVDALLFFISHELTAPVWGILEFSRILEAGSGKKLDADSRDLLARIIESAARLQSQIRDMTTFARLVRSQPILHSVPLEVALGKAIERTRREREASGAEIRLEKPMTPVSADEGILVLALEHLLSNAMRFTAAGVHPSVRIIAEDRGDRVRLWVEDNGIGIAPDHAERIFRLFERLHNYDAFPGTGIGLAVVRRAADLMEGSCGVESAPGQGSRFWIQLAKG